LTRPNQIIQICNVKYKKTESWEFIFLGANIDTAKEAGSIGISQANVYNFEASKDGVEMMYCMVSEAASEKRNRKRE
jgi:hypothetical protein